MLFRGLAAFCIFAALAVEPNASGQDALAPDRDAPLRVAIAGLVHGHVAGFLNGVKKRTDVQVVGLFDPDRALLKQYADKYGFGDALLFTDLNAMLDSTKPEAIAAFTDTFDHPMVVRAGAKRHLPVMMEKPMAVSMVHAREIQKAATESGIPIVVNYETTWYRSHAEMWRLLKDQSLAGNVRKMVAMDGHEGPKEIHVGPEFFKWLVDPVRGGGGALYDFGCYGANLMTWMMDNQRPISVTAFTQTFKPAIYGSAPDEANVLVQYAKAVGIIEGSWNWPYGRKDFDVYGEHGYAKATGGDVLKTRFGKDSTAEDRSLQALPEGQTDSVAYLKSVARGKVKPAGLSSLENNMVVVEILDAARESARTGRAVKLPAFHPHGT